MQPRDTIFQIVRPGGAFNKLYAFAKRLGQPLPTGMLNWPTVVAKRDGKVIGFLSTLPVQGAIFAGPLMLEKPSMLTTIRLGEAYEVVLRMAGVNTYFHLVSQDQPEYIAMLERLGYTRIGVDENQVIMKRVLT